MSGPAQVYTNEKIEGHVQARRVPEAKLAIKHLIKQRNTSAVRAAAADWYRRLGMFDEALNILEPELAKSTPSNETEFLIYCRIVNLMGASQFALRALLSLEREGQSPLYPRVAAGIFLSNYRFTAALPLYDVLHRKYPEDLLIAVSMADCLKGMGETTAAIKTILPYLKQDPPNQLKIILHSALGEYFIDTGRLQKARAHLEKARLLISPQDRSTDAAILAKWWGILLSKEGSYAAAKAFLKDAFSRLYFGQGKPEAWLEVLVALNGCESHNGRYIERKHYLDLYPRITRAPVKLPAGMVARYHARGIGLEPYLRRRRGVWIDGVSLRMMTEQKSVIDRSLTVKLLALLIRAGKYGLPKMRVLEELWPDEVLSLSALQLRLQGLIHNLRCQGSKIELKDGMLKVGRPYPSLIFHPQVSVAGIEFLLAHSRFTRHDVEKYFGITRYAATRLLTDWQSQRLAEKTSGGAETLYRSINSAQALRLLM